jgi:hypothetical protein
MAENLSYHVQAFSDKVRLMNQTNGKSLSLTCIEARNLHGDIFALLAKITELSSLNAEPVDDKFTYTVDLDGGGFK